MIRRHTIVADENASVALEMAVSLMAFLIVFFGTLEFCRAVYADLYVGYAAHAAGRYAVVRGSSWNGFPCGTNTAPDCTATGNDITNYVRGIAPVGINTTTDLSVNTTWPGRTAAGSACNLLGGTNNPGCLVQVQVTYTFHFAVPFLPANTLSLRSASAVTISQ